MGYWSNILVISEYLGFINTLWKLLEADGVGPGFTRFVCIESIDEETLTEEEQEAQHELFGGLYGASCAE